jgi:hypothetical protein
MNMQVLRPSRKLPAVCDVFVCRMCGFDYGFVRIIRTGAFVGSVRRPAGALRLPSVFDCDD